MNTRQLGMLFVFLATFSFVGCGGGDGGSNSDPAPTSTPTSTPTPSPTVDDADSDGIVDAEDNCPDDANEDQMDSDVDGAGDACDPMPTTYAFTNASDEDTVSYTGQTHRQILIEDLVWEMQSLTENPATNVVDNLNFYFRFDSATSDDVAVKFALEGETLLPQNASSVLTYGAISTDKNLVGKIAGGDGEGGGETGKLINDVFFGWETGLDETPLPVELVDYLFEKLASEATDNVTPQIPTAAGDVALDVVTVDAWGIDYRQLIQKFLLGAVNFSQGTNDYLSADFANMLTLEDGKAYTSAEHDWDEAFGYFGAARNYGDYTDDEIRASGDDRRAEFANGYNDYSGDGLIDIRSEVNLANSTNCAKRDAGTAGNPNPTDFTSDVFDAFIVGREILKNASQAGSLSDEAQTALTAQIEIAARTWEACIAATVVHYINDTLADIENFDTENGTFTDLTHFKDYAKHWAEMRGFALALQFSPYSPVRDSDNNLVVLQNIYTLMGDAPVLPDGTRAGEVFAGGADAYATALMNARDNMVIIYQFDGTNVANW